MKLIVNADDFGKTKGVNLGIVDAYKYGVVTSTTIMANGKAFLHGVELLKQNPGLGVGVHLILTFDKPLTSGLSSLVDEEGKFFLPQYVRENVGTFKKEEVEKEFRAQIKKVQDAGIKISHIDGHHHVHALEDLFGITVKLAKELGVPVRIPFEIPNSEDLIGSIKKTEDFCGYWYDEFATKEIFKYAIDTNIEKSSLEIMCHPAYMDNYIFKTEYSTKRMDELDLLTSSALKDYIKEKNIDLINYNELDKI